MLKRFVRLTTLFGLGTLFALALAWVTNSANPHRLEDLQSAIRQPIPARVLIDQAQRIERPTDAVMESSNVEFPPGAEGVPTVVETLIRGADSSDIASAAGAPSTADVSARSPARTDAARPLGWCFFTTLDHDAVSDSTDVWSGSHSVLIQERSTVAASAWKVNALWQAVDGTLYRGSRLQFSVQVKGRGGVFLFLQAATERELLLANNQLRLASSSNRYFASIKDNSWMKLDIVNDIRAEADIVYFGIAHNGSASLWVDDVRVTDVGPNSPITSTPSKNAPLSLKVNPSAVLPEPTNLDFELISDGTADAAPDVEGKAC